MLRNNLHYLAARGFRRCSVVLFESAVKSRCSIESLLPRSKFHSFAQIYSMAKRKRSSVVPEPKRALSSGTTDHVASADVAAAATAAAINIMSSIPGRRQSTRKSTQNQSQEEVLIPGAKIGVRDGEDALRASPSAIGPDEVFQAEKATNKNGRRKAAPKTSKVKVEPDEVAEDVGPSDVKIPAAGHSKASKRVKTEETIREADPEKDDDEEEADPQELNQALSRPPPVNSSYLPLPWKGRLGYACLNTYLRTATPPVFSSRTCRIASILEHRHPLQDPSQPEHSTKNRPDKDQPPDVARGQAYVESLGIANVKDIPKMLRWNDKFGIKFLRLSSEMFPFASHDIYGYKLAPFASEVLAEAGRVAGELGHRLTTHPGQFTQLGSPRQEVVTASLRDLDYHCEMLDLLKLPEQQNRDAVMILHMGGVFGDKAATIARFKENYVKLPQGIKNRLVLENDDMCYSVHDLLPVCEELNIPMVLDYHHHNIIFDEDKIREGTLDIMSLYDRIKATWNRKKITQKMHYSEPTAPAITAKQRRKHSARVATFPPCAPDMDLMIEAKDKEQAVFALMRTFKLPGFETFNDVLPYTRNDENRPWKAPKKKKTPKKKAADDDLELDTEEEPQPPPLVPDDEISMGGPDNRVFWPEGMEEWLRPKKREVKPRDPEKAKTTSEKAAQRRAEKAAWQVAREASADGTAGTPNGLEKVVNGIEQERTPASLSTVETQSVYNKSKTPSSKTKPARAPSSGKKKKTKSVLTPSTSDVDDRRDYEEDLDMPDLTDDDEEAIAPKPIVVRTASAKSGRNAKTRVITYAEVDDEE